MTPPGARLQRERQKRPWERRTRLFANQTSRGPAGPAWNSALRPSAQWGGAERQHRPGLLFPAILVPGAVALRRVLRGRRQMMTRTFHLLSPVFLRVRILGTGERRCGYRLERGLPPHQRPECDLPSHTYVRINILQLCPQKGKILGPVTSSWPRAPGVQAEALQVGLVARQPGRAVRAGPGRLAAEAIKGCRDSSRVLGAPSAERTASEPRKKNLNDLQSTHAEARSFATLFEPVCLLWGPSPMIEEPVEAEGEG